MSVTGGNFLCVHYSKNMTHMTSCTLLEAAWVDWSPDGPGSSSEDNDELTEQLQSSAPNTVF